MFRRLAIARETYRSFERAFGAKRLSLFRRRPQPVLLEARNFDEYQNAARNIAQLNSHWLRDTWFEEERPAQTKLGGYCAACEMHTYFDVDFTLCVEWEGRKVPWWTNTLKCPTCHLPARMRAALHLFGSRIFPDRRGQIYITEQTTGLYQQFHRRYRGLVGSEFLAESTPRGALDDRGFRCEDLTDLTFDDASFDHVLSFEVFEHIPDYMAALKECARVLRRGGSLFCSVPFHGDPDHQVRARVRPDGSIEHLLPPEYHGDPVNPAGVLCYRYFGFKLVDELRSVGFSDSWALIYWSAELGYLGEDRVVFVAVR
jgi:hypothetical protein